MNELTIETSKLISAIEIYLETASEYLSPVDLDYLKGVEPRILKLLNNNSK